MSVLAGCGDKSEWICAHCAKCSICCHCEDQELVHINTKEAAIALGQYARRRRSDLKLPSSPSSEGTGASNQDGIIEY